MLPLRDITDWAPHARWATEAQTEQDLLITLAVVAIFADPQPVSRPPIQETRSMKLSYDRATDSLYVLFIDRPGADVVEVAPGVVADLDETGAIVGLDIDHASRFVDDEMLARRMIPIDLRSA